METKMKIIIATLLLLMISACQSNYQTVTQADDSKAYIQLNGNFWDVELLIDEVAPIKVAKQNVDSFSLDGKEVVKFEVTTGTHRIRVIRNGKLIVDRKIYVSNGNTFEVEVR